MSLEQQFPYRLAILAEGFSRQLMEVYSVEFGLSREEWRLLYLLNAHGQVDSLEIARRSTLDKVQVSRASQRLEDKGYIVRSVSDEDRRLRVYRLTDEGKTLFGHVEPQVRARYTAILEQLNADERAALETGISALQRAVNAAKDS